LKIVHGEPLPARDRMTRAALYAAWAAFTLYLILGHVFWRDEVRALTIALDGDTVPAMLRGLHGEGHPAIWYLLLRGAHAVVPVREVLPVVAFLVSAAATALFVFRSPFRPAMIALVLASGFALYEYPVVARNYGIAMLGLFALAFLYPRYRDRGIAIGTLLALLCNTNVPAALLAASFLLFWLVELVCEEGLSWSRKYGLFLVNAGLAALGALLCFVTVFPTVHDAAPIQLPGGIGIGTIVWAVLDPATSFSDLLPPAARGSEALALLFDLAMFGSLLGLVRAPAALLSALAALIGFELFFHLVYPGYYRHACLFLVFLITLYWLVAKGRGGGWRGTLRPAGARDPLVALGTSLFLLLLAVQVPIGAGRIVAGFRGEPFSQSRNLALLLGREHLGQAVVIGDPDMFLEALPYYASNPLYFMREQRFGRFVRFTRRVRTDLNLDDYLADGRALQARTHRPVVILLRKRIDRDSSPFHVHEAHIWNFSGSAAQIARFLAATRRIARFGHAVTNESYDVYVLRVRTLIPPVPLTEASAQHP
jgi:hypothetical protein